MKKCIVFVVVMLVIVSTTLAQNELTNIHKQANNEAKMDVDQQRWLVVGEESVLLVSAQG